MFRVLIFLATALSWAQNPDFSVAAIPAALTANANAVVREEKLSITIKDRKSMTITRHRVVTILNKLGTNHLNASESGDVRNINAIILDAAGREIKRFKQKDFKSEATADASEITDEKIVYLDFTPVTYPFTLVFDSEVHSENTAFIPWWRPIDDYNIAVEKSEVSVSYPTDLKFTHKVVNPSSANLTTSSSGGRLFYSTANLPALKYESLAPSISRMVPIVRFALQQFHLEGVDGNAESWKEFGLWTYKNLLEGTDDLPEQTKAKIRNLVGTETDPLRKAAIVYKYVQDNTRYVSIQLGIGGWKPMKASTVDRLGYGDCKALSNYTRALLATVGVPSYYTLLYASDYKVDLQTDLISQQGNHAILAIPNSNGFTMLECTSQTAPFGFLDTHFDDRDVLIIKPDGGEVIRTPALAASASLQTCKGTYAISPEGVLSGTVAFSSTGMQYGSRLGLNNKSVDELDLHYKELFSNVNDLKIRKSTKHDNREKHCYEEQLEIVSERYADVTGGRIIFPVNAFNNQQFVPQRYRNRTQPFEIQRGYSDVDEVEINLPEGYTVEAQPENTLIAGKFGSYTSRLEKSGPTKLKYLRSITINQGSYSASEYEEYRKFREQIARNDNAKVVLAKTP